MFIDMSDDYNNEEDLPKMKPTEVSSLQPPVVWEDYISDPDIEDVTILNNDNAYLTDSEVFNNRYSSNPKDNIKVKHSEEFHSRQFSGNKKRENLFKFTTDLTKDSSDDESVDSPQVMLQFGKRGLVSV
jgi:hypothetical protein